MRLLLPLALLMLALYACEAPLPDGAYEPRAWTSPGGGSSGLVDAGRADTGTATPLLGGMGGGDSGPNTTGGTQGGVAGGTTGGGTTGGGTAGGDAGTQLSPLAQRLDKLVGSYLVRMDMMSTTTLSATSFLKVSTSNRVSHLLITKLYREGEQLRAVERLCYQTFQHRCTANCSTLSTKMSDAVIDKLVGLDLPRTYKLSDMNLSGEMQTAYFGFDSSSNKSLPSSSTDSRVWDPVPGGAREGMLLFLSTMGTWKNFSNCGVYNVQQFTSIFSGKLGGTSNAPSLKDATLTLTSGGEGVTLGSTSSDCGGGGTPAETVKGTETVHFFPVAEDEIPGFDNCPAQSEWDQRMAPPAP